MTEEISHKIRESIARELFNVCNVNEEGKVIGNFQTVRQTHVSRAIRSDFDAEINARTKQLTSILQKVLGENGQPAGEAVIAAFLDSTKKPEGNGEAQVFSIHTLAYALKEKIRDSAAIDQPAARRLCKTVDRLTTHAPSRAPDHATRMMDRMHQAEMAQGGIV